MILTISFIASLLSGFLADTPIEEFTPTPAFPALQYLESVDEGGVAWKAGLRTGDFLIEVRIPLGFHKLRGGSVARITACRRDLKVPDS